MLTRTLKFEVMLPESNDLVVVDLEENEAVVYDGVSAPYVFNINDLEHLIGVITDVSLEPNQKLKDICSKVPIWESQ